MSRLDALNRRVFRRAYSMEEECVGWELEEYLGMYVDGIGFANRCHYRSRCQRGRKHLSDAAISIARPYRHCRYRYREILPRLLFHEGGHPIHRWGEAIRRVTDFVAALNTAVFTARICSISSSYSRWNAGSCRKWPILGKQRVFL